MQRKFEEIGSQAYYFKHCLNFTNVIHLQYLWRDMSCNVKDLRAVGIRNYCCDSFNSEISGKTTVKKKENFSLSAVVSAVLHQFFTHSSHANKRNVSRKVFSIHVH